MRVINEFPGDRILDDIVKLQLKLVLPHDMVEELTLPNVSFTPKLPVDAMRGDSLDPAEYLRQAEAFIVAVA